MLNISDVTQFFGYEKSCCISQLFTSELEELQKSHSTILREQRPLCLSLFFFFYLSFISQTLTIHRTVGEEGGYLFNSYIPILFLSQKLTLSHQLDPDRELLFLKHQLLTTKTRP